MSLCDSYQPEFVARYHADNEMCSCPVCTNNNDNDIVRTFTMADQQRETLNISCEKAARALLFNPDAFILYATQKPSQDGAMLSEWDGTLNQQCINLAVNAEFTLQLKLFAIGMLLSKAQQLHDAQQRDVSAIVNMGEELVLLMKQGVLKQQFAELPTIKQYQIRILKEIGSMRLALNLPMTQKMSIMLKLSELAIMQPDRLEERLVILQPRILKGELFEKQPFILQNLLIYLLYSNIFPGIDCKNYGEAFFELARDFFQLGILTAIWQENNATLTADEFVTLVSAWFNWRSGVSQQESGFECLKSILLGMSLH